MRVIPRGRSCGCDPCNDWRAIVKELWNKYQNVVKSVIVNGTRLSPDGNGDVTMNLKTINGNGLLGIGDIVIQGGGGTVEWGNIGGSLVNQTDLIQALNAKQATLVSGTNIKTVNNQTLLGTGNINLTSNITLIGQRVITEQNGTTFGMQIAIDENPTENVDIVYLRNGTGQSVEEGMTQKAITDALNTKQATLVSGTNIKTINGTSLLGSGNIAIGGSAVWGGITGTLGDQTDLVSALGTKQATLISGENIRTINNQSLLGSGNIRISPDISTIGPTITEEQTGTGLGLELAIDGNPAQTVDVVWLSALTGQNIDIGMTQKAITDALNTKQATASMYTTGGVNAQTSANPVTLMDFVNSSIATNTANYISNNGSPFTSLAQLQAYSGTVTNNDYAFVVGTDAAGNTTYTRYKATVSGGNVTWAEEYVLNNSSFTAAQWNAINSGITTGKVSTYDGYASLIATKQDALVSGTNIKTINNQSLLGSGNIGISTVWGGITGTLSNQTDLQNALNAKQATLVSGTNIKTVNNQSLLGSGNINISGGSGASFTKYTITIGATAWTQRGTDEYTAEPSASSFVYDSTTDAMVVSVDPGSSYSYVKGTDFRCTSASNGYLEFTANKDIANPVTVYIVVWSQ